MVEYSIDEALNVIGFGRLHYLIFFGCFTQQMFVSNEQFGISLVIVAASCDYYVDEHRMSWLMVATFAAQACSSHFMGYQADKIGRRKLMIIASTSCMTASFISSLMPEFWSFLVMRFVMGIFVPGPGMAVLTYLSEFTKFNLRPKVINFLYYAIGVSLMYMAGKQDIRVKIHKNYAITSWRILMWLQLVPGIVSCIIFTCTPESPKYYLSVGKPDKAYAVLEKCCRSSKGKDVTLKSLGIDSLRPPETYALETTKTGCARVWEETKPIFTPPILKPMMLITFTLFLLFGTGFGLTVWIPRALKLGNDLHKDLILCDMIDEAHAKNITFTESPCHLSMRTLEASIYLGACAILFSVLITVLFVWTHRKIILLLMASLSVAGGLMLNFVKIHELVIVGCVFLTVPALCSIRLALSVLIDAIPTHLRSKAVSLSTMFGRVGVLVASMYVGYTLSWNCFVTFNMFVVFMAGVILLVSFLPFDGKTGSRVAL
ncbi:PREDICTED: synaptic vesicle glycoprotein 2B-like isoform X2 [Drosophila arizonae]|uniref:Synaptic vesicle glycoprotein 2B-like isoform X2 n=1 Tax=Drosophila arizonae TaxID=7263 RepID=A0ABM1P2Q5_DROAR|nr:PREDICTED: synaptic vesicle glycoprotein 2B-like isoform X2 [Drosophila arizonae]